MKTTITIAILCSFANLAFSQNFGIDNPSPAEKLDVNGNIRASGGLDVGTNGTYNTFRTWTNMYGYHGIYSSYANGSHFYVNNGSYGSWRIAGERNGWYGLEFDGPGFNTTLMMGHTSQGIGSQQIGAHNNNWGWLWRFDHQRLVADGLTDINDGSYYTDPNSWSRNYGLGSFYLRNNYGVDTDHQYGMYFDNGLSTAYAIFREGGGWSHPYPDLRIAFHTGIELGANYNYGGIRFYTDYDMSDVIFIVDDNTYAGYHNIMTYGYAYAYYHYDISSREKKKEIQKFDNTDYESALSLMDDIDLNYFRYKQSDLVPGIHMGLIAEETPTVLTDGENKGISPSKLGYVLTGAVKTLKRKVETLEEQIRNISDFGVGAISSNQQWVTFSEDFKAQLQGTQPVVTVTPSQLGVMMSVSRVSQEGFMVEVTPQNQAVTFNWIAMAKIKTTEESDSKLSQRFETMLQSAKTEKRIASPPANPDLVKPVKPSGPDPRTFNNNLAVTTKETVPPPKHNQTVKESTVPDTIKDK